MPKANIAHLHYPACITQDFFFSTVQKDRRVFVDKDFNVKIFVTDADEVESFVRVEKYLKTHSPEELREGILEAGFFTKKRFCCRNTKDIFTEFNKVFFPLFIFLFEPLFKEAIINTVETLIADNAQGLELRVVVGWMLDKENK